MKLLSLVLSVCLGSALSLPATAQEAPFARDPETGIEELVPSAPGVEEFLEDFDAIYEQQTGQAAHLEDTTPESIKRSCYRQTCRVWARISRAEQKLYLYVNGALQNSWLVSTGLPRYETPRFDRHPNGRIYDRYDSRTYPEGDYMGMGNMPYAVFIQGGYALHGTPRGNWSRLGRKASHGCIRQHPDKARVFNRLVRAHGIRNTWITVE